MVDIYDYLQELENFRLEFLDSSGARFSAKTYIKKTLDDYILINPPDFKNKHIDLEDGQDVTMAFYTDSGVITAFCRIIGRELGKSSGIKLTYPYNSKVIERREFIRVPLKVKVELTNFEDNTYSRKTSSFITTRNISGSGMSFISQVPFKDYFDLECKIFLEDNLNKPSKVKCELVYSKKIILNNKQAYLNALTYTYISEEDSSRIIKECFKYQIIKNKRTNDKG